MFRPNRRPLPYLLLATLLVAGQLAAAAHAFQHEPGTPQTQVCATCIIAADLGAAIVDQPAAMLVPQRPDAVAVARTASFPSAAAAAPRQRGPPPVHPSH